MRCKFIFMQPSLPEDDLTTTINLAGNNKNPPFDYRDRNVFKALIYCHEGEKKCISE